MAGQKTSTIVSGVPQIGGLCHAEIDPEKQIATINPVAALDDSGTLLTTDDLGQHCERIFELFCKIIRGVRGDVTSLLRVRLLFKELDEYNWLRINRDKPLATAWAHHFKNAKGKPLSYPASMIVRKDLPAPVMLEGIAGIGKGTAVTYKNIDEGSAVRPIGYRDGALHHRTGDIYGAGTVGCNSNRLVVEKTLGTQLARLVGNIRLTMAAFGSTLENVTELHGFVPTEGLPDEHGALVEAHTSLSHAWCEGTNGHRYPATTLEPVHALYKEHDSWEPTQLEVEFMGHNPRLIEQSREGIIA